MVCKTNVRRSVSDVKSSNVSGSDLPIIVKRLAEIQKAPWNYKEDHQETLDTLIAGIKKDGYVTKISIAERMEEPGIFEVIDGNHRLDALKVVFGLNAQIQCVYCGVLNLVNRQRIGLQLNELKFSNDFTKLADLVSNLLTEYSTDELCNLLPYQPFEIDSMAGSFQSFGELNSGNPGIEQLPDLNVEGDNTESGRFILVYNTDDEKRYWLDRMNISDPKKIIIRATDVAKLEKR